MFPLDQPYLMTGCEPRRRLQGRLRNLGACREFKANNGTDEIHVGAGVWQKYQQKSLTGE